MPSSTIGGAGPAVNVIDTSALESMEAINHRLKARPEIIAAVRERFPQGRKGGVGRC